MLSQMLCAKVRYVSNALGYQPPSAPHSRDRGSLRVNLNPCVYLYRHTFCHTTMLMHCSTADTPSNGYLNRRLAVMKSESTATRHILRRFPRRAHFLPAIWVVICDCNTTMTFDNSKQKNLSLKKCQIKNPTSNGGAGGTDS